MKKILVLIMVVLFFIGSINANASSSNPSDEQLNYMTSVAEKYNICPELIQTIIEKESTWDEQANNGSCQGLMQISSKWHTDRMDQLGAYDLYDWRDNILVGTDYIAELVEEYRDIYLVLMAYNGTTDFYEKWQNGEYTDYAISVSEWSVELEINHGK